MDATTNLSSIPDVDANFGFAPYGEPTIGDLLADPLTQALMKADHVDVGAFERMLHSVADNIQVRRVATQPIVVLKANAGAKFDRPIFDAPRWGSFDRSSESAAARSMHERVAAHSSQSVCGSICSW